MRFFLIFVFVLLSLWLGGLFYFLSLIPLSVDKERLSEYKAAEAIVIFTGDHNRISEGLELSSNSNIKYILISGVAFNSTLKQIVQNYQNKHTYLEKMHIELGKKATNTVGNIHETKEWVEKNHFHSLIVVTSNYHLPRCDILFRKKLRLDSIYIYPTFSENFDKKKWWKNLLSIKLIFKEYNKYLACKFALFFSDQ